MTLIYLPKVDSFLMDTLVFFQPINTYNRTVLISTEGKSMY